VTDALRTPAEGDVPAAEAATNSRRPAIVEYRFGPFRMDLASMQLWKDTALVSLAPKAFDTLRVLIANRDRVVSKDELLSAIWPNTFVSEESVHQNITSLRRALGDEPGSPKYVATVARRGYRFVGTAEPRFSTGPADQPPPAPQPAIAQPAPPVESVPSAVPVRSPAGAVVPRGPWRVLALAACTVAVVSTGLLVRGTPRTAERALRFSIGAPASSRFLGGALSPDGSRVAVVADEDRDGQTRLWLKPLDAQGGAPRIVAGSDGAARPFWSPDGQWIGFFANGRLKKVSVEGGPVQTLATFTGPRPSGGAWGPDGTILYASYMSGILALRPGGQTPDALTALNPDGRDIAHRWPHFTGDGRHFVYTVVSIDAERAGTYLASVDAPESTRLVPVQGAIWADPGLLVYVRDGLLMAQRVDLARAAIVGTPVTLSGEAQAPGATNEASLSTAANGLLAFTASASQRARLEWVTRAGQPIATVQAPTNLYNPSLSPDQRLLMAGTGRDIWLVDLERNATTRMGPGNTTSFSPDGLRIAFTSGPGGGLTELHIRDAAGASDSRLLVSSPHNKIVTAWSPDGRSVVYCAMDPTNQWDIWAIGTHESAEPARVLATPFNECQGHVSPNGRWLAYSSDESGTSEIYVQAFPSGGSKRAVSIGGGSEPQWQPDGRELFYVAADGTLTSVQFDPTAGTPMRRPVPLFRIPLETPELNTRRNHYVVGERGQTFLVSSEEATHDSFGVLLDWSAGLR